MAVIFYVVVGGSGGSGFGRRGVRLARGLCRVVRSGYSSLCV